MAFSAVVTKRIDFSIRSVDKRNLWRVAGKSKRWRLFKAADRKTISYGATPPGAALPLSYAGALLKS